MKKSLGLGLLALLAVGMLQSAAFADPPRMVNGRIWQNSHNDRCDHDRRDNRRDYRRAERDRWQFQKQQLIQQRRLANQAHRDRMSDLRVANGRYYNANNRSWFRW